MIDKYGVIYYTYGNKFPDDLEQSVNSVRKHNRDLKIAWITEIPNHPKGKIFDEVVQSVSKKQHGWYRRTDSLMLTPFYVTLHLDSDTIVNGDLSFGFEKADKFDLALCHAPAYYAKQFFDTTSHGTVKPIKDDQPVYNCGSFFFKKCDKIKKLMNKWSSLNNNCKTGQDQIGFSNAIELLGINPYVLTKAWNFRGGMQTEGHGPIKIWHSHEIMPINKINSKGFFKL